MDNVFRTICAGFNVTPDVCIDEKDAAKKESSGSIGTGTIIMLVIALVLINALLIYCYRRATRREMKDEINMHMSAMMSQYFALADNKVKPGSGP